MHTCMGVLELELPALLLWNCEYDLQRSTGEHAGLTFKRLEAQVNAMPGVSLECHICG